MKKLHTVSAIAKLIAMSAQDYIELRHGDNQARWDISELLLTEFHDNSNLDQVLESEDGEFGGFYAVHLYMFRESDNSMISFTSPNESYSTWRLVLKDETDEEITAYSFDLDQFEQIVSIINTMAGE